MVRGTRSQRRSKGARGTNLPKPRKAGNEGKTRAARTEQRAPEVRLGRLAENGIAPSLYALVERGAERRPKVARTLRGKAVIRFEEDFSPVRITFAARGITVEDGDSKVADLEVTGSLPDIVHFATAPQVRGVPNPARARGRAAIRRYAGRHVTVAGNGRLARGLLRLLAL